jgi:polyisoprenyl-phosphate glycosyltransferase
MSRCLSIVVPVYNEQESIAHFLDQARPYMAAALARIGVGARAEFLFVDDGSRDATPDILALLAENHADVRFVRLSRNFGKEAALAAGLRHAIGDAVIPMDVDLQDPPELIVDMVGLWRDGAKVVNARRTDRATDSAFKRWTARAFYKIINTLAEEPIPADVGDFRLLDRSAVDVINRIGERARFNKGLFAWVGFRVEEVCYTRQARDRGTTKWGVAKLWRLALDGITSTSTVPLRIWTYVGGAIALAALGYAAYLIARTIIVGADTPGYASLMVTMLLLGALNLLSLGIMGEYIGRIAREVRGRPLYIVESDSGVHAEPAPENADTYRKEEPWIDLPMRA